MRESAVELYTGSLWATDDLELYITQPRLLIAELFAMGFRRTIAHIWWKRLVASGAEGGGEDHRRSPATGAGRAGKPPDDYDRRWTCGSGPPSLNVIGIEDVIAEQVASWRTHRAPSSIPQRGSRF